MTLLNLVYFANPFYFFFLYYLKEKLTDKTKIVLGLLFALGVYLYLLVMDWDQNAVFAGLMMILVDLGTVLLAFADVLGLEERKE